MNKALFLKYFQAIRLKYMHPDTELQNYLVQIMDMLRTDSSVDAQSLVIPYYFVALTFLFLEVMT